MPSTSLSLSRDNFLDVLGFSKVRKKLTERQEIDDLYNALVDFIQTQSDDISFYESKRNVRDLDFKVPGTPIHFNLSSFLKDKIEAFISVYLIIEGASEENYIKIGSGIVVSFMSKFSMLRKKHGELCLVESLSEIESRSKENICLNLYGKECRYPKANCQFYRAETNSCLFNLDSIGQTLENLENKKILQKVNIVEPVIWKIEV